MKNKKFKINFQIKNTLSVNYTINISVLNKYLKKKSK